MKTFKKGERVTVDLGYKHVCGVVTEDSNEKYVTVKHDNFAGEVFKTEQTHRIVTVEDLPF